MKKWNVSVDITMSKSIEVEAVGEEEAIIKVNELIGKNPYEYANNFSHYVSHEVICAEPEEEPEEPVYSQTFHRGLAYVRANMDPDDLAIIKAEVNKNYKMHQAPATGIDEMKVLDLLEEYGDNEGLSEGWYLEEYDADEVMLLI